MEISLIFAFNEWPLLKHNAVKYFTAKAVKLKENWKEVDDFRIRLTYVKNKTEVMSLDGVSTYRFLSS